jgi:succinate dehydrogenase / fumarate reductase cytochrome b subunit
MNWLINTLGASIGKKLMMAITGLCFCCFLIIHLAGNLTLYGGQDLFNAYAEHLHSLGPLITISEWILVTLAIIHVLTGATLFYQNYRSRPVGYTVNQRAGGRSLGSATMPYTGFVLFAFIIFHLVQFHFTDKANTTIYQMVANAFADPVYVCIYVAAMIVAAIHVSHGLWSAFQTIGANHPKYMPVIAAAGIVFALIVGIGFGFIPMYFTFIL